MAVEFVTMGFHPTNTDFVSNSQITQPRPFIQQVQSANTGSISQYRPRPFGKTLATGIQVILGMTTRRTARVNRAIQEAVSTAVLFKVKDPRVKNVTVLRAEATDDLRQAKVYVSVMGDEKRQALTMNGLAAARGFLQSKVADRLQTKQTPILTFVLDQTVKQNAAAQAALSHLFPVPKAEDELEEGEVAELDDSELEGLDLDQDESEFDDDDDAEVDDLDEFEDEDFETEDLIAIDGAGERDAAIRDDVHESTALPAGVAEPATRDTEVRHTVSGMEESQPAEPEENEELPSR